MMLMNVRKSSYLLLLLVPLLSGCLKNQFRLQPKPPPELTTSKPGSNDLLGPHWLAKYHTDLAFCSDESKPGPKPQCADGTYATVLQAERNSYISAIELEVDESYDNFKASLYAGHAYLNVALT
jgi:hypothetical protein